jgi:hypothetical protein
MPDDLTGRVKWPHWECEVKISRDGKAERERALLTTKQRKEAARRLRARADELDPPKRSICVY